MSRSKSKAPVAPKTLSLKALEAVFGVSAMSIYLWRKGRSGKTELKAPFTPARVRAWAGRNEVAMRLRPELLLETMAARPTRRGRPAKTASDAPLKRTATGRMTGVRRAQA